MSARPVLVAETPCLDRPLPSNVEAERSVLGAVLLRAECYEQAAAILKHSEDWYLGAHRTIFAAMATLSERKEPIDPVTLRVELERRGEFEAAGGAVYIASLIDGICRLENLDYYAKAVRSKAVLRRLLAASHEISAVCFEGELDDAETLDLAESLILDLADGSAAKGPRLASDVAYERVERIEQVQAGEIPAGLPTGLADFDYLTGGLHPGQLVVIGARPAAGKTALAIGIADDVASRGASVLVVSEEMTAEEIGDRQLSRAARVDLERMKTGEITRDEHRRLCEAAHALVGRSLVVEDTPGLSVLEIRSRARRVRAERGLDLVVVDYLQLLEPRARHRSDNRTTEVSQISRDLKALAKELRVPVVALSQVSRACETREDRRPLLADLRESGQIEADANIVAFLYRDEMYWPDVPEYHGTAELIIRKNRDGRAGTVLLSFVARYASFENAARDR